MLKKPFPISMTAPKRIALFLSVFWIFSASGLLASGQTDAAPAGGSGRTDSGIVAVYLKPNNKDAILALPQVKFGQVAVSWAEIEPAKGKYDFSPLAAQLADYAKRGMRVTVEISGYHKPHYLFNEVPYVKETGKEVASFVQVKNSEGTLMFWHPAYERAFVECLTAFRNFLAASPYKKSIFGLRMNFNPFGCETFTISPPEAAKKYADRNAWIRPPGLDQSIPYAGWSQQAGDDYMRRILHQHLELFAGVIPVFLPTFVPKNLYPEYQGYLETGTGVLFATDSLFAPISRHSENRWSLSLTYCKTGKTLGYAEPMAGAWGVRNKKDDYILPPVQAFYWRLLCDLHKGVSYIACYGGDLAVAVTGEFHSDKYNIHHSDRKTGENFKGEFTGALTFAALYAGYHAQPGRSPGAWIALRGSDAAANAEKPEDKLSVFTGDYTFLMEREADPSRGVMHVGPDAIRFGGYARELPANETMRFKLNENFAASLAGKPVTLAVTYFSNSANGTFTVTAGGQSFAVAMKGGGKWETAQFAISGSRLSPKAGETITIRSGSAPLTLHLVEVRRRAMGSH